MEASANYSPCCLYLTLSEFDFLSETTGHLNYLNAIYNFSRSFRIWIFKIEAASIFEFSSKEKVL